MIRVKTEAIVDQLSSDMHRTLQEAVTKELRTVDDARV
jgi:hypothetical protein